MPRLPGTRASVDDLLACLTNVEIDVMGLSTGITPMLHEWRREQPSKTYVPMFAQKRASMEWAAEYLYSYEYYRSEDGI